MENGSHSRGTELGQYVLKSFESDEKGLEDYIDRGGFQPNMYSSLFSHFREIGNYKRKKYYLLSLAKRDYSKEQWFRVLESELTKEDYEKERENLLEYYKEYDIDLYAVIMLKEGDSETVLKYLQEGKIHDSEDYYFTYALADEYPIEIYHIWVNDVRANWEHESYRSNYDEAIRILHRVRSHANRNGMREFYKIDLASIIEDNKSRKKFIARVKREGLLEID